jgi:hypothetical protein
MSIYTPGPPALGDVGSYQVSAKPFFKGGAIAKTNVQVIEFPSVTNWIHIRNNNTGLASDGPLIAFSENGFNTNNYFQLLSSTAVNDTSPQVFYVKVSKLFYKVPSGNLLFDVVAGLTNIPTGSILDNWSGSAGVG